MKSNSYYLILGKPLMVSFTRSEKSLKKRLKIHLCLFLSLFFSLFTFSLTVNAEAADEPEAIFEPDVKPREINIDTIDDENLEVGITVGAISIEDFESNLIYGANIRYHFSEDFFTELNISSSDAGLSSYERLSGAAQLLTDDEREYLAYSLDFGFNLLPGEAFVARSLAFNSRFYLLAGLGNTDFAGDTRLTINFGFGYQLFPTDWMAIQLFAKDHMFDVDVTGSDKTTHNFEFGSGFSVFF